MNSPDAFDDLARHKLEGRSFPFDEGHWQDMQRVLAAEQRRKRRGLYWSLAAALLMVGGGLAWLLGGTGTTAPVTEGPVDTAKTEIPAPAASAPSTSSAAATHAERADHTSNTLDAQRATPSEPAAKPSAAATSSPVTSATNTARNKGTTAASSASRAQRSTSSATSAPGAAVVPSPGSVVLGTGTPQPTMEPRASAGDASSQGSLEPALTTAQPSTPADTTTSTTADLTGPSIAAATPAQEPTATMNTTPPQDSAASAAGGPVAPPVIPDASPWELTAWGGLMRAHTTYSGSEVPWPGTISDANAPVFGAEVIHMGRNLGLGAGLHYVTYAEQYQQPELSTDVIAIDPVYTVVPIDTSLLVVTGTVMQNGQLFYITETVDTALYVLDIGADTTITSVRLQEGIDRVNHVSYLELPLLIDGHVDAGNWRFGLRGGPTVGLLTGRRGSVPVTDPSGSIELSDQPFREYMFGWTLRAYIRYKLSDRWWIGLEPMARGQLMNAYGSGELDRRSSSMGLGFSVSYRLP